MYACIYSILLFDVCMYVSVGHFADCALWHSCNLRSGVHDCGYVPDVLRIFVLTKIFDVFFVEVRTVLAFDVTPVVGLGVLSDRWKKMSSCSVVVLLPPGILLLSIGSVDVVLPVR